MFNEVRKELIQMTDKDRAKFTVKTCPDLNINEVLGIKIPELRKIAKKIAIRNDFKTFLKESNKHEKKFLEETIIEGLVIAYSKINIEEKLNYIEKFIPQISNWIINDTFCSTIKLKSKKEQETLWSFINPYLKSSNQFEVRFAVVIMLENYIIPEYVDEVIYKLDKVQNNEYYAQMAIAWTLAEVGIKFNDKLMIYLKGRNNLDKFTYNKTLQKMIESYRITKQQKEELKIMKKK